jgi:hypothetical protein
MYLCGIIALYWLSLSLKIDLLIHSFELYYIPDTTSYSGNTRNTQQQ